ncbi:ABC-2 family transporter protein [Bacillus cereus]|uniref:ABC transporter permease n=1 Tax=Bacillus cereus group TaxID=86661 RepID=UPI000676EA83|nr:ABC-2 family transporter protein [Bacillus thuringiensis]MEB8874796.1 ABC-2 family transporter protein [Bacillus cereus]AKR38862.1 ABC transporter permease [Bacillus thuringiensis serovar indiana]MBG9643185.1 hypothetical protein [Bacillus thuringiensis]MBG9649278.1 hypothetical protein [Bacillus thuringiensis]MEB9620167.1 ABC-2 family transporter protein [Bacillus cereus]
MLKYLTLFWHFQLANIKSKSSYSFNFILGVFSVIFLSTADIMLSWIITREVPNINGYGFYDLVFIFSLWMIPHSFFIMFFIQTWDIDSILRHGKFDRYLTRPLNPLFQFSTSNFEVAGIGDFIAGLIGLFIAFPHVTEWDSLKLLYLIPTFISGLAIEWSIYILISCTAFWTLQSKGLQVIIMNFLQQFTRFPVSIYSFWVQTILTFAIPVAFINYYPSFVFLGGTPSYPFSKFFMYLPPIVALILVIFSCFVWKKAINNYEGAGT